MDVDQLDIEQTLWLIVLALALGDALTTTVAVFTGLAVEQNPVIVAAIVAFGPVVILLFKLLYVGLLWLASYIAPKPYHLIGVSIGLVLGSLILANNLFVLLVANGLLQGV